MKESTIAAVATAYGESGIGIIRMSGPEAFDILKKIFVSANGGHDFKVRYMHYGFIQDPDSGERLDEVLAVYMKAPHTYTGEDVVEIQCHGSVVSLRSILALCLKLGAEAAQRGEFTKRAFLNGRLDLSQAEAVTDLIRARSSRSFDIALKQMEGELSSRVKAIRAELLELLVSLTVNMDYPDEDIEEITYQNIINSLSSINDKLLKLISSSREGKILREGLSVAIVGKPNVGKSSLMNVLLRENRSIVTDVPGTTRDTVEEQVVLRGIQLRLIDTAGIHATQDVVESLGIERSKEAFDKADLIILLLDASRDLTEEDRELLSMCRDRAFIAVLNKQDLPAVIDERDVRTAAENDLPIIRLSLSGEHDISELEDAVEAYITGGRVRREEDILVSNERHIRLLNKALAETEEAKNMAEAAEAIDFIEVNCRAAFDYLGEITGDTAGDEVIEEIFSRFCLGK